MAYIVGFISKDKRKELERRGWEVEDASDYNLIGEDDQHLLREPPQGDQAVVIWVDTDVFAVMDGPDWDKGAPLDPYRPADNWTRCPKCKEMFGWNDDDGLAGQECECCGYEFTGSEGPNGCSGPEDAEER